MRWVPSASSSAVRRARHRHVHGHLRQRLGRPARGDGPARAACSASSSRCRSGYYADNLSGNLISKFSFDVIQVATGVTYVVTILVRDGLTVIGLLAFLLWLNWKLTLITFATIPPIALAVRAFNRRLRKLDARDPALDGRHHPGPAGDHRGPEGGQDLRRPGVRARRASARPSNRVRRLHHEGAAGCRRQRADGAAVRGDRGGRRDSPGDARRPGGPDHRRQLRVFHRGDAAGDGSAQAPDRRDRAHPARLVRRGERVRAAGRDARGRSRHASSRAGSAARSASSG